MRDCARIATSRAPGIPKPIIIVIQLCAEIVIWHRSLIFLAHANPVTQTRIIGVQALIIPPLRTLAAPVIRNHMGIGLENVRIAM